MILGTFCNCTKPLFPGPPTPKLTTYNDQTHYRSEEKVTFVCTSPEATEFGFLKYNTAASPPVIVTTVWQTNNVLTANEHDDFMKSYFEENTAWACVVKNTNGEESVPSNTMNLYKIPDVPTLTLDLCATCQAPETEFVDNNVQTAKMTCASLEATRFTLFKKHESKDEWLMQAQATAADSFTFELTVSQAEPGVYACEAYNNDIKAVSGERMAILV